MVRMISIVAMAGAASASGLAGADLSRAEAIVPRSSFRGEGFVDTADTLSALLRDSLGFTTKPCAEFSLEELNELYAAALEVSNSAFDDIYAARGDPRALRVKDAEELHSHLEGERRHLASVEDASELLDVIRDGKCAELAMMLTHHLEETAREELGALFKVPELSTTKHPFSSDVSPAHQAVHALYQQQATCAICHEDQSDTGNPLDAPLAWGQAHVAFQEEGGSGLGANTRYSNRWYNWDLRALREETVDAESGRVTFGFVHVGPIMYMYQPLINVCIPAPIGWAPVSPDWLQAPDSLFIGNETVPLPAPYDTEFNSQVWNRPDPISGDNHFMWVDLESGRPVRMEAEAPGGSVAIKLYLEYEELSPEDPRVGPDVFAPPSYCRTDSATQASEAEIEEMKKQIFRFPYW